MRSPFFLNQFNRALNAYLQLDSESNRRLKRLEGKAITIKLLPFNIIFQLMIHDHKIILEFGESHIAQTKITGTPIQLMNIMISKNNRHSFFADDVLIEGDAELGQRIIHLFDALEIDHEEMLSHFLGDISAYHLNRVYKNIKFWVNNTKDDLTQDVSDYIHEEKAWLPSRQQLKDFFDEVDELRMAVDRLEAKIKKLEF